MYVSHAIQVRIVAAQALMTIAIRSGEPYRLQVYELLQTLAQGGLSKNIDGLASNGEDQGASGTGLSSILSPMIRLLDEMYKAQDELIRWVDISLIPQFAFSFEVEASF